MSSVKPVRIIESDKGESIKRRGGENKGGYSFNIRPFRYI